MSSRAIQILIPLLVTILATFFGMFLPMAADNSHNVPWESVYGLGFYLAGFVTRSYLGNLFVGLTGLLLWPLVACVLVFFAARRVMGSSLRVRILVGIVFVASLFACVATMLRTISPDMERPFTGICMPRFTSNERSNPAMQLTAGRSEFPLDVTSTFRLRPRSLTAAAADLVSR